MAYCTTTFLTKALSYPITIHAVFPTDKMVMPNAYLPERKPMKTLYFLEGFAGASIGLMVYTKIQAIAEDYNLCVITLSTNNKQYADSSVIGDYYDKMVLETIEYTRKTFRLSDRREDTYLAGFSMGGYGTFTVGLRHPELFSYLIPISAALVKNIATLPLDENGLSEDEKKNQKQFLAQFDLRDASEFEGSDDDHEYLAKKVSQSSIEKPKILMACGENDVLYPLNEEYMNLLKTLGFDVSLLCLSQMAHSWAACETGLLAGIKQLPLDTFQGNISESETDSNFGLNEYFNWDVYYNLK